MPTYSSEWDKGDYRANNEQRGRMGFGGTEHGGQTWAQRSRMLGDEAQKRATYQSDFTQGNQARGVAGQGVDLALSAAKGQQPSAAEVLAKRNTAAAMRTGQALAGGVKGGPGARVAAMRNAQRMGAQMQAEGGARAEELRAREMADARGQVIQGGLGMRAGDHDAQRIQQANELTQRGLNDTQQRFFEQQGFNTQVQDQDNQFRQQQLAAGMWKDGRAAEQSDEQFGFGKMMKYAEAAAGAASGAAGGAASAISDEKAKNLMPMGSLAPMAAGAAAPTFDKLSPVGGMDVMGSLKAHSDYATRFQRDPTGGMVSDVATKSPRSIMYSPGEIKDPVDAPSFMASEGERREDADPYMRVADTGATGAPRGYAAARAGHAGSMFSEAPDPATGFEKQTAATTGAPGTEDWAKFGAAAKNDGEVDWKHGGSTTPKGKAPNPILGSLAGMLGGLSSGARMRSDVKSKDVMYSDDKTKLAAAFEAGKAAAKPEIGGKAKDAVKAATGKDAKAAHDVSAEIAKGLSPVGAPFAIAYGPAREALQQTMEAKPEDARAAFVPPPAAKEVTYAALGPVAGTALRKLSSSDEKAKDVIDLDGDDKSRMRDGSSDARTNSFDKTFRRDTKADQKAVKKGVEDKAGRDADAMMAGFGASLKQGPTARVEDVDSDDKPDLRDAARAKGDAGNIPEHAMFRAMKAMEPSLYSYKPEFRPPEQAPGEVQAGPMANNMERDPIAGTAITKDPGTGLLAIDKDKALKLTMGSLATLAQEVEQLKRKKGAK